MFSPPSLLAQALVRSRGKLAVKKTLNSKIQERRDVMSQQYAFNVELCHLAEQREQLKSDRDGYIHQLNDWRRRETSLITDIANIEADLKHPQPKNQRPGVLSKSRYGAMTQTLKSKIHERDNANARKHSLTVVLDDLAKQREQLERDHQGVVRELNDWRRYGTSLRSDITIITAVLNRHS